MRRRHSVRRRAFEETRTSLGAGVGHWLTPRIRIAGGAALDQVVRARPDAVRHCANSILARPGSTAPRRRAAQLARIAGSIRGRRRRRRVAILDRDDRNGVACRCGVSRRHDLRSRIGLAGRRQRSRARRAAPCASAARRRRDRRGRVRTASHASRPRRSSGGSEPKLRLLRIAPAIFVDLARATRGLPSSDTRLHYDAGAGIRIALLGFGVLRADVARGLRDGAMAVSVGWQR